MTDTFSRLERSSIMQKVKSHGNKSTEQRLIFLFKQKGITGWRRNYPVTGKPDFVFVKNKIAIFADGCFWHGHNCRNVTPKHNKDYWNKKRQRNVERDKEINLLFQKRGWTTIRVWECDIKAENINFEFLISLLEK